MGSLRGKSKTPPGPTLDDSFPVPCSDPIHFLRTPVPSFYLLFVLTTLFFATTQFLNMEKITEKIAALPPDANYFSLEFFPPKTQMVGFPL